MTALMVIAGLAIVVAYALERLDHRLRTGRIGWTCEAMGCSCRGSLDLSREGDDLVVRPDGTAVRVPATHPRRRRASEGPRR
mgnify:CR=1 FL=1